MSAVVKVTRKGQTTIPRHLREKYGIEEGDEVLIEDTRNGLLIRRVPKLHALAGIDSGFGKVDEINRELESLREEY